MSTAFDRQRQSIMGDVVVPAEVEDQDDASYVKVVTVHSLLKAFRSRRLWVLTALLGLVIGAGLHAVIPPQYSATTKLYLAEPSGVDPNQAMTNDASLLTTEAVAKKAMQLLHQSGDVASFASSYRGVPLSESILSITSSGASIGAAERRVDAIAQAFLELRAAEFSTQTDIASNGIRSEIKRLQSDIGSLTTQISATPSGGSTAASMVTDLVNQRSGDESQVVQLESQLQQAAVNVAALTQGSRVIDPGFVAGTSIKKVMLIDGLTGLIGGLALGIMIIVLGLLLGEGVRRRDLLTSILSAPVELSVGRVARSRRIHPSQMRRMLEKPPGALRMIERRLVDHVDRDIRGRLIVAEVEATEIAAVASLRTAMALASTGRQVVLVDSGAGRLLSEVVGKSMRRPRADEAPLSRSWFRDTASCSIGSRTIRQRESSRFQRGLPWWCC